MNKFLVKVKHLSPSIIDAQTLEEAVAAYLDKQDSYLLYEDDGSTHVWAAKLPRNFKMQLYSANEVWELEEIEEDE